MNLIAQLEFELTHNNIAVQYISHYATRNPSDGLEIDKTSCIEWLINKKIFLIIISPPP